MSTSTTAFRDAVVRVRAGEDPRALASELYAELTDRERLGLLDGDTPFWSGMEEMVLEGYVTTPLPMGFRLNSSPPTFSTYAFGIIWPP